MSGISAFSNEISLYDDEDQGLRIECSEKFVERIKRGLASGGLQSSSARTQIAGTSNIHDWVEFDVLNGDFEAMKLAVIVCLQQAGITVKEESFSSPGEKHVRLDLVNVSVFDK
ncbi:hypothetical protein TN889_28485 [Burkholderia gladioli pv. alliicola]|uniref:hypothetical protein n=1 Tax=Burkholderia gladioli TaxID=28095 RepID=UPI0016420355|nr:hypothetical protein [Burkholderia gladioli]MBJ9709535.1 hypothetical protein [Burkholderia gladioli]MDZ4040331.1 hypothetical protein [Burkholderia gladioli pv. alliicola]